MPHSSSSSLTVRFQSFSLKINATPTFPIWNMHFCSSHRLSVLSGMNFLNHRNSLLMFGKIWWMVAIICWWCSRGEISEEKHSQEIATIAAIHWRIIDKMLLNVLVLYSYIPYSIREYRIIHEMYLLLPRAELFQLSQHNYAFK